MKEAYFTPGHIGAQAEELLEEVIHLRSKSIARQVLSPKRAALVILDLQRYFLDISSHAFIPSAQAIIPNILKLRNIFLGLGLPVILTKHINTAENAGQMKVWWSDMICADSPFALLLKDLEQDNTYVFEKSQYDAFFNTELESYLLLQGVEQVIITGVMTHLCCESTARSAFMRGFQVFFAVDGTADYNRQFHLATLRNLSHGFAVPVLCRELLTSLDSVVSGGFTLMKKGTAFAGVNE